MQYTSGMQPAPANNWTCGSSTSCSGQNPLWSIAKFNCGQSRAAPAAPSVLVCCRVSGKSAAHNICIGKKCKTRLKAGCISVQSQVRLTIMASVMFLCLVLATGVHNGPHETIGERLKRPGSSASIKIHCEATLYGSG